MRLERLRPVFQVPTPIADKACNIGATEVDMHRVQDYREGGVLVTLEVACDNKGSREHVCFYEFPSAHNAEVGDGCEGEAFLGESNGFIAIASRPLHSVTVTSTRTSRHSGASVRPIQSDSGSAS